MFPKVVFFLLIVYSALNLSHGQKDKKFFRKDYHYLEATKSFYRVSTLYANFHEAKRSCALEGASLFYPENQAEADAVISVWNTTYPTWWALTVGISDVLVKGVFETIDGKRVSEVYNNWAIGEPNDSLGIEDCVILGSNGQYNDVPCDRKTPYICKKTLESLKWDYHCNMSDLGYTYNEKTGSCYKLHSTPLNWTEAYNVCSAEQSYLAVINNFWETESIVQLTETAPKDWFSGSYLRGLYHMGFHNRFNTGWQTVKGTSINDTLVWWSIQPIVGSHDQCGAMFYTGYLNQIDCGTKCMFICEHDVNQSSYTRNTEENVAQ